MICPELRPTARSILYFYRAIPYTTVHHTKPHHTTPNHTTLRNSHPTTYLVVLRQALGPARRASLDLPRAQANGEVGDVVVLRLARPMRRHDSPPALLGQLNRVNRLRHRPDLVHLHCRGNIRRRIHYVSIRCVYVLPGSDSQRFSNSTCDSQEIRGFRIFVLQDLILWEKIFLALRTEFWANYTSFIRLDCREHR